MIKINYPDIKPLVKQKDGKDVIFCCIRKRWFNITPEEWVRQNFLLFLIHVQQYPASLIAVEKQLLVGDVKKRFDIVVYKNAVAFLIVECKEMKVPLSKATLIQVLNYNLKIQAPYIAVTNGNYCAAFKNAAGVFDEIFELPE